jgi:hypothetical protein
VWSDNIERGGEWSSLRGMAEPAFQNRKGRVCVCKHVRVSRSTCPPSNDDHRTGEPSALVRVRIPTAFAASKLTLASSSRAQNECQKNAKRLNFSRHAPVFTVRLTAMTSCSPALLPTQVLLSTFIQKTSRPVNESIVTSAAISCLRLH